MLTWFIACHCLSLGQLPVPQAKRMKVIFQAKWTDISYVLGSSCTLMSDKIWCVLIICIHIYNFQWWQWFLPAPFESHQVHEHHIPVPFSLSGPPSDPRLLRWWNGRKWLKLKTQWRKHKQTLSNALVGFRYVCIHSVQFLIKQCSQSNYCKLLSFPNPNIKHPHRNLGLVLDPFIKVSYVYWIWKYL